MRRVHGGTPVNNFAFSKEHKASFAFCLLEKMCRCYMCVPVSSEVYFFPLNQKQRTFLPETSCNDLI